MSILWDTLENNLRQYFDGGTTDKNRSFEKVALEIENMYVSAMVGSAQDKFGNRLLILNGRASLAASLREGFKKSLFISTGPPIALNSLGLFGLSLLWQGSQLSMEIPPPGSVKIVSNVIINASPFPTMNVAPPNSLLPELMNAFKLHANTVSGICTSLVNVAGNLVPTPFPWTGVK